ncbi:G-protein coupled receptor 20-like [Astyanax mexicanus]|uniref:G-protein coupled receptor 20-like n=1 Tax=Astyanax mexicanus TaxID=7994 RepID=A0A8T2KKY8_ASTMX|nr:G-protein coupled receptor 20-like [Astyanax mexicanus]
MIETQNSTSVNTTSLKCPVTVWNIMILAVGATDCVLSLPFLPWALWVLLRRSQLLLETELFVLNILLADVCCIIINLISFLNSLVFSNSFQNLFWIFFNGYPLFQCSVCFELYLAVVHPVTFLKYKPLRYKAVCLFFMWLIAFTSFTFGSTVINDLNVLLSVIIPVVCFQTFFSLSILKVLKRSTAGDRMRNQERERERKNCIKKRALVVVCIFQIKLVVNYLPFIVFSIFKGLFQIRLYSCYVSQLALSICFFGHFIHSFLYLQKAGRLPLPQFLLH